MSVKEFFIDDSFLVRASGTSDGTQDKYCKDGFWFKLDRHGGEGRAETAASIILKESGFPVSQFVEYETCLINGKPGCCCKDFLKQDEDFITLYRLFKNVNGRDLAAVCSKMDYDDAIEYVLSFVKLQTGLDLREYFANTFELDRLILNEDRHFNNLGVIYDGENFRTAPIFDNGKSFLVGNKRACEKASLQEKVKTAYAKAFSPSFSANAKYLQKYRSLKVNAECVHKVRELVGDDFADILSLNLFDSV